MTTLLFADLGEAATRRILRGWCGPLVPEQPSERHDHRKHRLMYMDCTSPQTLEGHVLTFTHSQWSCGMELVFEDGTPRTEGMDPAVGRRVLSWETCWKWIERAGLDCSRPEVNALLKGLCARAQSRYGTPDPATVWIYYTGDGMIQLMAEDRSLYELEHDPFWTDDGNIDYGAFVRAMVLDLAPKIAALP